MRVHDLRHTGQVLASKEGTTLADIMNRLGHSTVDAAMAYAHLQSVGANSSATGPLVAAVEVIEATVAPLR